MGSQPFHADGISGASALSSRASWSRPYPADCGKAWNTGCSVMSKWFVRSELARSLCQYSSVPYFRVMTCVRPTCQKPSSCQITVPSTYSVPILVNRPFRRGKELILLSSFGMPRKISAIALYSFSSGSSSVSRSGTSCHTWVRSLTPSGSVALSHACRLTPL